MWREIKDENLKKQIEKVETEIKLWFKNNRVNLYKPTDTERNLLKQKYPPLKYNDINIILSPAGDFRFSGPCKSPFKVKPKGHDFYPLGGLNTHHGGEEIYPSCFACWAHSEDDYVSGDDPMRFKW